MDGELSDTAVNSGIPQTTSTPATAMDSGLGTASARHRSMTPGSSEEDTSSSTESEWEQEFETPEARVTFSASRTLTQDVDSSFADRTVHAIQGHVQYDQQSLSPRPG